MDPTKFPFHHPSPISFKLHPFLHFHTPGGDPRRKEKKCKGGTGEGGEKSAKGGDGRAGGNKKEKKRGGNKAKHTNNIKVYGRSR